MARSPAAAWLFLCLFSFGVALALVPEQWAAVLHGGADTGRAAAALVIAACLAYSVAIQLPGLISAGLLLRLGRVRAGLGAGTIWSVSVAAYLLLDLSVLHVFGRRLHTYVIYLDEPEALRWTGELDAGPWLGAHLGEGAAVSVAAGLAWLCARAALRRGCAQPGARLMTASALSLLAITPIAVCSGATPPTQAAMARALLRPPGLPAVDETRLPANPVEIAGAALYQRSFPSIRGAYRPPNLSAPPARATPLPDVLYLVLESFRADALDPGFMPNLWKLAASGARFDAHYSGSNASHGGLFSVLYSRPPVGYEAIVHSHPEPDLVRLLSQAGYRTHYISGAETAWRGMDRFVSADTFDSVEVHTLALKSNWQRDRDTIASIRARLAETRTGQPRPSPRLVVAFFMSTHFAFDFPAERAPFQPIIAPPTAIDPGLADRAEELRNRYRNSAHYVDSLIGELVRSIDLDRSIVVVTGDHGESIFEDGTLAHSSRLSAIQTRVPLIIAGGPVPPGTIVREPSDHADLLDTLLARLGLESPDRQGQDLLSPAPKRPYIALVAVDPDARDEELILRDAKHRYLFRLDRQTPTLHYHGLVSEEGTLTQITPTEADNKRAQAWLTDFFQRWWQENQ